MRLAQLSDFHFTHLTINPLRLMSKRFFGSLNWLFFRKSAFVIEPLLSLPDLLQDLKVDWVLLGGDFTSTSLETEFETAQKFVNKLKRPWIAIPGNHDHYTAKAYKTGRYFRYFPSFALQQTKVELHTLSALWAVIALDTARPTHVSSSTGLFSKEMEEALEKMLQNLPKHQQVILFNHYPFFENHPKCRNLERGDALEALILRHPRICLYLHGHTHRNTVANLQASGLPVILDSGSCTHTPCGAWNLIDLQPQGCSVTAYHWENQWKPFKQEEIAWSRSLPASIS